MNPLQKVRWEELTEEQQKAYGNGCGPKWAPGWAKKLLFGWFFEASCKRHDFAYSRGGDEHDRYEADRGFKDAMLRDVKLLPWYLQPAAYAEAWSFYAIVRAFGSTSFHYGDYKTLREIIQ
jgi:hypothetical protein